MAGVVVPVDGVIGYYVGEHRVLMMRLDAQLALCHIEIEQNTWAQPVAPADTKPTPLAEPKMPAGPAQISEAGSRERKVDSAT